MTVKELIDELKKHKPESTVWTWDDYQYLEVDEVAVPVKRKNCYRGDFWYLSEKGSMEVHTGALKDKVILV